ncbi:MAG: sulfate respiration complex protein HmcD [Desulfobacterales bacterium]
METIHTLQEFMLFTKGVTYLIIIAALVAFPAWWLFLTQRDEDRYHEHHEE